MEWQSNFEKLCMVVGVSHHFKLKKQHYKSCLCLYVGTQRIGNITSITNIVSTYSAINQPYTSLFWAKQNNCHIRIKGKLIMIKSDCVEATKDLDLIFV